MNNERIMALAQSFLRYEQVILRCFTFCGSMALSSILSVYHIQASQCDQYNTLSTAETSKHTNSYLRQMQIL